MPVQRGNKIHVNLDTMTSKDATVNWNQNLASKTQQYYIAEFINKHQGDEKSIVFIQKSYLDDFKSKIQSGEIIIDSSFQYGQKDKTGAGRWLVFHDKRQKPLQFRFLEKTITAYGQWLFETFGANIPLDIGYVQQFFRDPLCDF